MKLRQGNGSGCRRIMKLALALGALALVAFGVLQLGAPAARAATQFTRYQQSDSRLLYTGTWHRYPTSGSSWSYSGGSYKYSSSSGAAVTIPFRGTAIYWVAKKGPGLGRASVSVDGGTPVAVNLSSGTSPTLYKQRVFGKTGLSNGLHTLKITRTSGTINMDAVDVAGTLASATRYQETDSHLLYYPYHVPYAEDWKSVRSTRASGGSYRFHYYHASLTIRFTGCKLDYVALVSPSMGQVQVFVDGVSKGIVNLHSATTQSKKVWSTGFLRPGTHTVEIEWHSGNLSIDAVDIIGSILTTEEAAIRTVVAKAVRGAIGSTPFDPATIQVTLIRGQWGAAWFPGPPHYEDGFCVLSKASGSWRIVWGIENMWWSSSAELTSALRLAGVPASFATELAGFPSWVP